MRLSDADALKSKIREQPLKENAKNSNKKDELVKVLKQARDAINGYSTCPYCWGVNGHAKGCKFYEALQNIDALIGGKEDARRI